MILKPAVHNKIKAMSHLHHVHNNQLLLSNCYTMHFTGDTSLYQNPNIQHMYLKYRRNMMPSLLMYTFTINQNLNV